MKLPLTITARGLALSAAIENKIRNKAQKLITFCDQIIRCDIVVCAPHKHHCKGNDYNVKIDIKVSGADLVVQREPHKDLYVAIRDAFNAARRRLLSYIRKQRQKVKLNEPVINLPNYQYFENLTIDDLIWENAVWET